MCRLWDSVACRVLITMYTFQFASEIRMSTFRTYAWCEFYENNNKKYKNIYTYKRKL